MSTLTTEQFNQYKEQGYVSPIDVLSLEEVEKVLEEIEHIEKKWPNELIGLGRNNVHYVVTGGASTRRQCHPSIVLICLENEHTLVPGTPF